MKRELFDRVSYRLRGFHQSPRRAEHEIKEEIADHLDRLESRYLAQGYSERRAREAALEQFGDPGIYASRTVAAATAPRRLALLVFGWGLAACVTITAAVFVGESMSGCSF